MGEGTPKPGQEPTFAERLQRLLPKAKEGKRTKHKERALPSDATFPERAQRHLPQIRTPR